LPAPAEAGFTSKLFGSLSLTSFGNRARFAYIIDLFRTKTLIGNIKYEGKAMTKLTIRDVSLQGKRVLMRVDFNVPLDDDLRITDDTRIRAALPTITYALEQESKVILMSHLGRPKGNVVDKLRLDPVGRRLSELLRKEIIKLDDCVGDEVTEKVMQMREREVVLLENLRFHKEEEENDTEFAQKLAGLGNVYVNDAFGTAHRAHASTVGVTKFITSVCGLLLQKEIEYLDKVVKTPQHPFVAILGGAKVSDKIGIIENLISHIDWLLIGGGMAYTFLKVQGKEIGNSKLEEEKLTLARETLDKAKDKIILPSDHIIVERIETNAPIKTAVDNIPQGWIGVDIGPQTVEEFITFLKPAKTIFWNGPLGIFEIDAFSEGTKDIGQFVAQSNAISVIGGGDTVAAVSKFNLEDKISHISTGGGASLEYLEGKVLPGIAALTDK
jgi:phosphoglycerate kinase